MKPEELCGIHVLRSFSKSFDIVCHPGSTLEYKV